MEISRCDILLDIGGCFPVIGTVVGLVEVIYGLALKIFAFFYQQINHIPRTLKNGIHEVEVTRSDLDERWTEFDIANATFINDLHTLTNPFEPLKKKMAEYCQLSNLTWEWKNESSEKNNPTLEEEKTAIEDELNSLDKKAIFLHEDLNPIEIEINELYRKALVSAHYQTTVFSRGDLLREVAEKLKAEDTSLKAKIRDINLKLKDYRKLKKEERVQRDQFIRDRIILGLLRMTWIGAIAITVHHALQYRKFSKISPT